MNKASANGQELPGGEAKEPSPGCDLLKRLESDLASRVRSLQGVDGKAVNQVVHDLVTSYTCEICQRKSQVQRLQHLHMQLQSDIDRKEKFLSHILEESADAIITMDADQQIVIWNRGAEAIFGFREEEIVGRPIKFLVPRSRRYELRQIEEQARRHGSVRNRLAQWQNKAGNPLQVILTNTAIHGPDGEYAGSSFLIKDVTRQRELEEEVRQAEHISSIGRLAAGLAHEIKNPLAGIQGAIEVIRERSSTEFDKGVLSDVLLQVRRIDKIVRDLLQYAKPRSPEIKTISLESLLRRLISLLEKSGGRDVDFVITGKGPGRKIKILGDESGLEHVVLNLLLNSVEAMGGQGRVNILFRTDSATLTVRFEDNGPGVPIGLQKKIFDPFFTTKAHGTGLGLATCQRIVYEHGGILMLDPQYKQGAAFVLKLPRER